MAINPNPALGTIKGQAVLVLEREQRNVLSDKAVDCRGFNAVLVQVFVTGASAGADLQVEGAPEQGGPYLPLPDPSARQTGVASNKAFDVVVGASWVKVRIQNRTDGVFTVIVTPYISPGATQISISATANQNLAQVGGASVSLGQKAMAQSIPVVVASDQGAVAVDSELPAAAALADGAANPTAPTVGAGNLGFNGATWDRLRTGAAAVLSAVTQSFGLLVTRPGEWTVVHAPAANTQATATKTAGGAGVRHVCTHLTAVLAAGTTAPSAAAVSVVLRDGPSGTGAILWQARMSLPAVAGEQRQIALSGLNIVGSANTAMTLEFDAAGGANTFESVTLGGYSVS